MHVYGIYTDEQVSGIYIYIKQNSEVNDGFSHPQISLNIPRQIEELCHYKFEDFVDINVVGCT